MSEDTPSIEARIIALEAALRDAQDRLAIYDLVATYGIAADGRAGSVAAELWTEDGIYQTDFGILPDRAAIAGMLQSPVHIGYTGQGSGHVMAMPHITIDGDRAVATNHTRLYLHGDDGFHVERLSANRWELTRTERGWRVARRILRLLDGQHGARELFAEAFTAPAGAPGA